MIKKKKRIKKVKKKVRINKDKKIKEKTVFERSVRRTTFKPN